jgi:hypothetical protein
LATKRRCGVPSSAKLLSKWNERSDRHLNEDSRSTKNQMEHVFHAAAGLVAIDRERICGNQQVRARVRRIISRKPDNHAVTVSVSYRRHALSALFARCNLRLATARSAPMSRNPRI